MLSSLEGRAALLKYLPEVLRTRAALRVPDELQRSKLFEILARNAATEYGRAHGFSTIRSVADFQSRVPTSTFETLRPFVERMAAGEPNVLTASAPMMFAQTSGTTREPKLIPITPEFRDEFHSRIWFVNLVHRYPRVVHTKGILAVTGAAVDGHTEAGIPIGSISGHIYQTQRPSILRRYTLPYEVLTIRDVQAKYYAILRLAVQAGVRLIVTPNPSTILLLAEKLDALQDDLIRDVSEGRLSDRYDIEPEVRSSIQSTLAPDPDRARHLEAAVRRAGGHLRPAEVWPDLQAISCWVSGPSKLYLADLRRVYGHVPVHSMGYLASEGRGSLPFAWSGCDVLNVGSHFFEFIPEECREERDPPILTAEALEIGKRYFVLFTTSGGLYRYDIDDVVAVVGRYRGTPVVDFAYKGAHVHSFTGEKITEQQVAEAMSEALVAAGPQVRAYTLIPRFGRPPHYELAVEFFSDWPREGDATLAEFFDRRLAAVNVEYEGKRKSERLGSVIVRRLRRGFLEDYRRDRTRSGVPDAQVKVPALNPGERLLRFLEPWSDAVGAETPESQASA